MIPGLGEAQVTVHAKVLVIYDALVRVGSSNLSNRSMGLDTECDLAIEDEGGALVEKAISCFRSRLLGEHLGVEPERVSETLSSEGSLIRAVEKLRGGRRTLMPLRMEMPEWAETLIPDIRIADPEKPINLEEFTKEFMPEEVRRPGSRHLWYIAGILLCMLGLSAAWRWKPLGEWINLQTVAGTAESLRENPALPFIMMGIYAFGSLAMVPLSVAGSPLWEVPVNHLRRGRGPAPGEPGFLRPINRSAYPGHLDLTYSAIFVAASRGVNISESTCTSGASGSS